jgi:4,4'-diaponeurosporenoate glycosyltransferase
VDVGVVLGLAGWLVGWWLLWRVPTLPAADTTTGVDVAPVDVAPVDVAPVDVAPVDVAIVVPARDEEVALPALLDSLADQTVAPRQVIVVDDASTDGTAGIAAARPGVTLVRGTEVPDGWTGKTWACAQGVARADAGRYLFLDADVTLAPGALAALVAEHDTRRGLVSVQPFHRMVHPYEQLSAVFNVVAVMGVGMASPGRHGRARGAFGPCLLVDRHDYARIGGHEAVRGSVVEDVALARRAAAFGLPVHALGGGRAVAFRMYPSGLRHLIEGWTKNFATGAGSVGAPRLALIGLWITAVLVPLALVVVALRDGSVAVALGAALLYLIDVVQLRVMTRALGTFTPGTALAAPFLAVVFVAVFVRSVWRTLVRRRVAWRGRQVRVGPGAGPGRGRA